MSSDMGSVLSDRALAAATVFVVVFSVFSCAWAKWNGTCTVLLSQLRGKALLSYSRHICISFVMSRMTARTLGLQA